MVGDGLVGDGQPVRALNGGLLQQKGGNPLVHAPPHHLLHKPHDLREAPGHELVGVVGQGGGLLHQLPVDLRRDDPEVRVLLRRDGHVELNAPHDAGGGEQADVPVKQPVDGDLPALLREDVGPELPGPYHQQPGAVRAAVVEQGSLFHGPLAEAAQDPLLLGGR